MDKKLHVKFAKFLDSYNGEEITLPDVMKGLKINTVSARNQIQKMIPRGVLKSKLKGETYRKGKFQVYTIDREALHRQYPYDTSPPLPKVEPEQQYVPDMNKFVDFILEGYQKGKVLMVENEEFRKKYDELDVAFTLSREKCETLEREKGKLEEKIKEKEEDIKKGNQRNKDLEEDIKRCNQRNKDLEEHLNNIKRINPSIVIKDAFQDFQKSIGCEKRYREFNKKGS